MSEQPTPHKAQWPEELLAIYNQPQTEVMPERWTMQMIDDAIAGRKPK